MKTTDQYFLRQAIALARAGFQSGQGGPFGALVVKAGTIIGRGANAVTSRNDPTAHAEIVAIREACATLQSFQLTDCVLYTSCEPCPMCLGAIYWARPARVVYAASRQDAAAIGFDDAFIYQEITLAPGQRQIAATQALQAEAQGVFAEWLDFAEKKPY